MQERQQRPFNGLQNLLAIVAMLMPCLFRPAHSFQSPTHVSSNRMRLSLYAAPEDTLDPLSVLKTSLVVNPETRKNCSALDGLPLDAGRNKNFFNNPLNSPKSAMTLIVIMPQLGDFDTFEYAELLAAVKDDLERADIKIRVIGIGDIGSAQKFSAFARVPSEWIYVDPEGKLHQKLSLHEGPNWSVPNFIPDFLLKWFANYVGARDTSSKQERNMIARSWLNYMAMCAGIAAPDTLREIIRGYIGDKKAPERLRADETVRVGDDLIVIKGVTDVKLGPISYQSLWKDEKGYQRPAELATVRLRGMVEVLTNFNIYVPDQKHLHLRGATFLFDQDGKLVFEHRDTGVLAYSKTMRRPLTFLEPYIGGRALNPLRLGDNASY